MTYLWRVFCLLAICCVAVVLYAQFAYAHSWYSVQCCHDRDCKPLQYFDVKAGPEGFTVTPWGGPPQFIGKTDHRIREIPPEAPAHDAQHYHVCTAGGVPTGRILCLYVPQGGA